MTKRPWLLYNLVTTLFWGIWGALIELPGKAGFPPTLVYIVWALTMIPCALIGLAIIKWKLDIDLKSVFFGMVIGLTGAGGQIVLFQALLNGPAYLVFPIISLSPVITVLLSVIFLKETTTKKHWIGIILALIAIGMMSFQKPDSNAISGYLWFVFAILVFFAWGTQAFYLKGFTIAASDRIFHEAKAIIDGNKVLVWNDVVPHPVAIRYAWANYPKGCNLYNQQGNKSFLPASPFRTDDWPGITCNRK